MTRGSRVAWAVFGAFIGAIVGLILATELEIALLPCAGALAVFGAALGAAFGGDGLSLFQYFP